jgi:phage antirepressor YoqD-like protein
MDLFSSNTHAVAFDPSMFEIDKEKGMVNLTRIAKAFDKRLDVYLKTQETKELIEALNTELTPNGGSCILTENGKGTWANQELTLDFAQWISVKFKVFCIKHLKRLFNEGSTSLVPPKPSELSRLDILNLAMEAEKEKLALQAANEQLEMKVGELAPKAESYERFMSSDEAFTMEICAKILSGRKGKTIGRNTLFAFLRDKGILQNGEKNKNIPYQKYIDRGYFNVISRTWTDPETQKEHINYEILVYPKGLDYIYKVLSMPQSIV